MNACAAQVMSLFTVLITVIGILYFQDPNKLASTAGLNAVGVGLLILNAAFVLLCAALVMHAARKTIKKYILKAKSQVRSKSGLLRKLSARGPTRTMSKARAISLIRAASPSQDIALVTGPSSSLPVA